MTGDQMNRIRQEAGLSLLELARFLRYENVKALRDMCGGRKEISGPISRLMELIEQGRVDDLLDQSRID